MLDLKTVEDIAEGLAVKYDQNQETTDMWFHGRGIGEYTAQLNNVAYIEVSKFFFVKLHLYFKNPNYNPNANSVNGRMRYNSSGSEYHQTEHHFFDFRGPFSPIYRYVKGMYLKNLKYKQDKERVRLMENVNEALNLCGLKLEKDLLKGGKK